jgi:hypothetical protein
MVSSDATCPNIQPVMLGMHPHAIQQTTDVGKNLVDVRGWHGRLYFGYGDLAANTGPIEISSYDPVHKSWQDVSVPRRTCFAARPDVLVHDE